MADPIPVPDPTPKELERFWKKVQKQEDGCWIWTAAKFTHGYGAFSLRGKLRRAHRVAYVWTYGELGLTYSGLDHICNQRACVNPDHLRPATTLENTLRGDGPTAVNARRDVCIEGHPLDYTDPRGWRGCTICRREAVKRHYEANRERILEQRRARRRPAAS